MNLFDHDMPIHVAVAYVFANTDRTADMKQKPVYVLNHASTYPKFGVTQTLENAEASTDATGRKLYHGSGLSAEDLDFENMYDGFTTFHNYFIEVWASRASSAVRRWTSTRRTSASRVRTRSRRVAGTWAPAHADLDAHGHHHAAPGPRSDRQIKLKNGQPEVGVSGGPMPQVGDFTIWGVTPD